jgi:hypothetical protein
LKKPGHKGKNAAAKAGSNPNAVGAANATNPAKITNAQRAAVPATVRPPLDIFERVFLFAAGLWLGLSLVKFGNPIIFDQLITPPANTIEFLFLAWPLSWAYVVFGVVIIAAIPVLSRTPKPESEADKSDLRPRRGLKWAFGLLAFWLFWQFISSTRSVDSRLSTPTLVHFTSCVLVFVLGWRALGKGRWNGLFWTPILIGLSYVLFSGFDQHNGGLEATRQAFYQQPNWQLYPREYLLKIASNRVFGPLVYPNALAQLIILILPICLWQLWTLTSRWPRMVRLVVAGLFGYLGFACLYWTGSKGGWLVALVVAAVLFLHLEFPKKLKVTLISAGLVLGILAFFLRFSAYFEKGATSVGARFSYWRAAAQTTAAHPLLGTGPGTFSIPYKQLKAPEAEMAKLTHNDYLEQASDSGIPGSLAFTGFILITLCGRYRHSLKSGWPAFLIWLGLLGWALQAAIEFGLYIPALAWPMFLLSGLLWGLPEKSKPGNERIIADR